MTYQPGQPYTVVSTATPTETGLYADPTKGGQNYLYDATTRRRFYMPTQQNIHDSLNNNGNAFQLKKYVYNPDTGNVDKSNNVEGWAGLVGAATGTALVGGEALAGAGGAETAGGAAPALGGGETLAADLGGASAITAPTAAAIPTAAAVTPSVLPSTGFMTPAAGYPTAGAGINSAGIGTAGGGTSLLSKLNRAGQTANDLGDDFSQGAAGEAAGRRADANANISSTAANNRANLDAATFNLNTPTTRARQVSRGDAMSYNYQPAGHTGSGRDLQYTGGYGPWAYGQDTTDAGNALKRQAMNHLLTGDDKLTPQMSNPTQPSATENGLAGVGLGLNVLGTLAKLKWGR